LNPTTRVQIPAEPVQRPRINNILSTTSWRQLHHGGNYNNIMAATSTTSWRQLQQHHGGNFNNI
jgi:hypothetical protein